MDLENGTSSSYQNGDPPTNGQDAAGSKIKELQKDINQLTGVMQSNINKVLERGDRLDTLNERSELLSNRANEFRINSRSVRRKFWWQNLRAQLIIGAVVFIIMIFIIYSISK